MSFLHFTSFFRLKNLFVVVLALQLTACLSGNTPSEDVSVLIGGSNDRASSLAGNSLSLTWVAPAAREDGTGLSLSEIAGYRIYYGTEPGNYPNRIDINDGSADQAEIPGLQPASYYVVVTTVDVDGRESSFSQEVVVTL